MLGPQRGLLGTGPPDPTLESASPSPPHGSIWRIDFTSIYQKNPRAHKNKIGTPPPPPPKTPPQKKGGILRTWVFLQQERIFPGVHKIGAVISGPRIADTNFTDTKRIFLILFSGLPTLSSPTF